MTRITRITLLRLGTAATAAVLFACANGANEDAHLHCGPGTVEVDSQCVPDTAAGAGSAEAGAGAGGDAGVGDDARGDSGGIEPADSGPIVHEGDPCVAQYPTGGCSDNRVFFCHRLAVNDTVGQVAFDAFGDCSVLGGVCTVGVPLPACKGGGYTACDPADAGRRCSSSTVLEVCDTEGRGTWTAADCHATDPSYVCGTGPAGVGCGPAS